MSKLKCTSQNEQPISIPDHDDNGLESQIIVYRTGFIQGVELQLDIKHPNIGDLEVQVIAPNGKQIILHDRSGGDISNLKAVYSGEIFNDLLGIDFTGAWTLIVKDHAYRDVGQLNSWDLIFPYQESDTIARNIIPPVHIIEVEEVIAFGNEATTVDEEVELAIEEIMEAQDETVEEVDAMDSPEVEAAIEEIMEGQEETVEEMGAMYSPEVELAIGEIMEAQEETVEEVDVMESTEVEASIEEIMEAQEETVEEVEEVTDATEVEATIEATVVENKPSLEEILTQLRALESMVINALSSNEIVAKEVEAIPVEEEIEEAVIRAETDDLENIIVKLGEVLVNQKQKEKEWSRQLLDILSKIK